MALPRTNQSALDLTEKQARRFQHCDEGVDVFVAREVQQRHGGTSFLPSVAANYPGSGPMFPPPRWLPRVF